MAPAASPFPDANDVIAAVIEAVACAYGMDAAVRARAVRRQPELENNQNELMAYGRTPTARSLRAAKRRPASARMRFDLAARPRMRFDLAPSWPDIFIALHRAAARQPETAAP